MDLRTENKMYDLKGVSVIGRELVALHDRIIFPELGKEIAFYRDSWWCVSVVLGTLKAPKDAIFNRIASHGGEPIPMREIIVVDFFKDEFITLAHKGLGAVININLYKKEITIINKVTFFKSYFRHGYHFGEAMRDKRNETILLDDCCRVGVYRTSEEFRKDFHFEIISLE